MANFFKLAENLLTNLDQSTQSALHKTTNNSNQNAQQPASKKQNLSTSNQHQRTASANDYNLRNMFEQDDSQKRLSESFHVPSGQSSSSFNYATPVSASANNLKSLSGDSSSNYASRSSSRTNFNKEDELIEFLNNPEASVRDSQTKSQLSVNTKVEQNGKYSNQKPLPWRYLSITSFYFRRRSSGVHNLRSLSK